MENVLSLKMTTVQLNSHYGWRLTYKDHDHTENYLIFFSRPLNANLPGFTHEILRKNPNTKIQKISFGPFQIDKADN